jgi:transcription elongation factor Elf1
MAICIICNSEAIIDNKNIHEPKITCSSCGKFSIAETAFNIIPKDVYPDWRSKLQEWIRMNQTADYVLITRSIIKSIF